MLTALYCLKDLSELLSFLLLMRVLFRETPYPGKGRALLLIGVSAVCSAAGALLLPPRTEHAYEILDFIANLLAVLAIPLIFRKPRLPRAIFTLFLYFFAIDTLWSFAVSFLPDAVAAEAAFDIAVSAAVSAALYAAKRSERAGLLAGALQQTSLLPGLSLLLFELTCYYREFGASRAWFNAFFMLSACLMFGSVGLLLYRVYRLSAVRNEMLQKLNDQLVYAAEREASDESLRRFRHDFKNHTLVIAAMLEQGDADGARQYFSALTDETREALPRFSTGNTVVNTLMNVKYAQAAAAGAELCFEGLLPAGGVDPKDMCVLVGNLLDNAIEACARLPREEKKTISVSASGRNNVLILTVENPVPPKTGLKKNALPATLKTDKRAHGIGLRNVRDTAKRYTGTLTLRAENAVFTAELYLELPAGSAE